MKSMILTFLSIDLCIIGSMKFYWLWWVSCSSYNSCWDDNSILSIDGSDGRTNYSKFWFSSSDSTSCSYSGSESILGILGIPNLSALICLSTTSLSLISFLSCISACWSASFLSYILYSLLSFAISLSLSAWIFCTCLRNMSFLVILLFSVL